MSALWNPLTKKHRLPTEQEWEAIVAALTGGVPGGPGASSADREVVHATYTAINAFTGASVGDTITSIQVLDVSGATPSTVAVVWRNQSTAADLASAPSAANLSLVGRGGATEATLAALSAKLPATLGGKDTSASLAVTLSANGPGVAALGAPADAPAASDSAAGSLVAFLKRIAGNLTSLLVGTAAFRPVGATVTVAVDAVGTSAIAIPAGATVIRFSNAGSSPYAVAFGDGLMSVAYATAIDIMPSTAECLTPPAGATHMRLITASGTVSAKYTGGTGA